MCLTIPVRVLDVSADGATATIDTGHRRQQVSLMILADADIAVMAGDWLLLGAGLAIARLDHEEAVERIGLLGQAGAGQP